jgi:hypothetical protein
MWLHNSELQCCKNVMHRNRHASHRRRNFTLACSLSCRIMHVSDIGRNGLNSINIGRTLTAHHAAREERTEHAGKIERGHCVRCAASLSPGVVMGPAADAEKHACEREWQSTHAHPHPLSTSSESHDRRYFPQLLSAVV